MRPIEPKITIVPIPKRDLNSRWKKVIEALLTVPPGQALDLEIPDGCSETSARANASTSLRRYGPKNKMQLHSRVNNRHLIMWLTTKEGNE